MITRFYVDNYKCLTNFEYKPKPFELIVGANGTGKTTVFEALDKVRRFIGGESVQSIFRKSDKTRWSDRYEVVFELEVERGAEHLKYFLKVHISEDDIAVTEESLIVNDVIWMQATEVRNEGFAAENKDEPFYVWQVLLSPVATPIQMQMNSSAMTLHPLHTFKNILEELILCRLNSPAMTSQVGKARPRPASDLSNFASYYLYVLQQKQGEMFEMIPHLREVIEGFDSFTIVEDFEEARRDLRVKFQGAAKTRGAEAASYGFEELSDGQRALIALYTLLFCTLDANTTLVIDEPENYIALRELQPWLLLLRERLEQHGGQVILISHHPEFINQMAPESAVQFSRDNGGPVRVSPFNVAGFEGLTPAEIMARGLNDE